MESKNGQFKLNFQNILLVLIALLLATQLIVTGILLSMQIRLANAQASRQDSLSEMVYQYQEENKLANDDLISDYQRDRDVYAQLQIDSGEETDPQLQQIIIGNDYIIHALMRLATQDGQILELLSEMR